MAAAFVAGVVGAILYLREPTESLTEDSLRAARERWEAAGIRDYRIRYRMHGSQYDVAVHDGIVTEMTVNGNPPSTADRSAYGMDGLLDMLELELEVAAETSRPNGSGSGTAIRRVRFHPKLGYVERYLRGSGPLGPGVTIELSDFTQLDQQVAP